MPAQSRIFSEAFADDRERGVDRVSYVTLDQLRDDIDGISTSKRIFREYAAGDERILVTVGALAEKQAKLSEDVLAERGIREQEIGVLREEFSAEGEKILSAVGTLTEKQAKLSEDIEPQLAQLQKQILEQQRQICELQSGWAVRYAKNIKRTLGIK